MFFIHAFQRLLPHIFTVLSVTAAVLVGWQSVRVELLVLYFIGLGMVLCQQVLFAIAELRSLKEAKIIFDKGAVNE